MKPTFYTLFYLAILCTFTCLFGACQGENKSTTAEAKVDPTTQIEASPVKTNPSQITINYESPYAEISIQNNILNYTKIQQMFVENSASTKPDSTARTILATDMLLGPNKLELLETAIIRSGFMGLDDTYGATKAKAIATSTLEITFQGKTKKVVFNRSPEFERSPVSFKKVEAMLLNLHKVARVK